MTANPTNNFAAITTPSAWTTISNGRIPNRAPPSLFLLRNDIPPPPPSGSLPPLHEKTVEGLKKRVPQIVYRGHPLYEELGKARIYIAQVKNQDLSDKERNAAKCYFLKSTRIILKHFDIKELDRTYRDPYLNKFPEFKIFEPFPFRCLLVAERLINEPYLVITSQRILLAEKTIQDALQLSKTFDELISQFPHIGGAECFILGSDFQRLLEEFDKKWVEFESQFLADSADCIKEASANLLAIIQLSNSFSWKIGNPQISSLVDPLNTLLLNVLNCSRESELIPSHFFEKLVQISSQLPCDHLLKAKINALDASLERLQKALKADYSDNLSVSSRTKDLSKEVYVSLCSFRDAFLIVKPFAHSSMHLHFLEAMLKIIKHDHYVMSDEQKIELFTAQDRELMTDRLTFLLPALALIGLLNEKEISPKDFSVFISPFTPRWLATSFRLLSFFNKAKNDPTLIDSLIALQSENPPANMIIANGSREYSQLIRNIASEMHTHYPQLINKSLQLASSQNE